MHDPCICVIGGMNLDILGKTENEFVMRDSNIGHIVFRPGGVGRNIAHHIVEQGGSVQLITVLGCDRNAGFLIESCVKENIGLRYSRKTKLSAPVYAALHEDNGEMLAAINDMDAMNELNPSWIVQHADEINSFDAVVVDANLRADTIEAIAEYIRIPKLIDPVSCEKGKKCIPYLNHFDAVKPNLLEAEAMTGEKEALSAANHLLMTGIGNVYISIGKDGLLYNCGHSMKVMPAIPVGNCMKTGAGDAMCAGIAIGMSKGLEPNECATLGIMAAYNHLIRNRKES